MPMENHTVALRTPHMSLKATRFPSASPLYQLILLLLSSRPHLFVESGVRDLEAADSTQANAENGKNDNGTNDAMEDAYFRQSAGDSMSQLFADPEDDKPGVKNWYFSKRGSLSQAVLLSAWRVDTNLARSFFNSSGTTLPNSASYAAVSPGLAM